MLNQLPTWEKLAKVIIWKQIGELKGKTILDFGCGAGITADFFAANNQVTAIEPSEDILEYDSESKAIIMPGHSTDFHFPERAVMLFMETEVDDYALENDCEIIGRFISVTKVFHVYKTIHNGVELAVCQAPLGGAAAT